MLEQISNINPDKIKDDELKKTFSLLLNFIESQQQRIVEQDKLIQALKDEILLLKIQCKAKNSREVVREAIKLLQEKIDYDTQQ